MGMTIDEVINWLYRIRSNVLVYFPKAWHKKIIDMLDDAIHIISKYQKIEQIVNAWDDDENAMILVHKIKEVMEE